MGIKNLYKKPEVKAGIYVIGVYILVSFSLFVPVWVSLVVVNIIATIVAYFVILQFIKN